MSAIRVALKSLTKDRRSEYLWDTKEAAKALGVHENKLGDWVYRTRQKIKDLYRAQPGETAIQINVWLAEAASEMAQDKANGRSRD